MGRLIAVPAALHGRWSRVDPVGIRTGEAFAWVWTAKDGCIWRVARLEAGTCRVSWTKMFERCGDVLADGLDSPAACVEVLRRSVRALVPNLG